MALLRTRNPITVLGPDGKPLAGASVHTTNRPSGTDAEVFATETGGTPGSNPAVTDAHGRVVQWLPRGAYTSVVSHESLETYPDQWDSAPAKNGAIDLAWLAGELIDGETTVATLRSLGPGSTQAAPGNDARFPKPGDLRFTARNATDEGWLPCEGQAVPRVAPYKALFEAIGTTYGEGDKSTTFNVPDFRGRGPLAAGAGPGLTARARGNKGGEETHTLTEAELPALTKATTAASPTSDLEANFLMGAAAGGFYNFMHPSAPGEVGAIPTWIADIKYHPHTHALSFGGGGSHNNMQPYTVCNVWIKT